MVRRRHGTDVAVRLRGGDQLHCAGWAAAGWLADWCAAVSSSVPMCAAGEQVWVVGASEATRTTSMPRSPLTESKDMAIRVQQSPPDAQRQQPTPRSILKSPARSAPPRRAWQSPELASAPGFTALTVALPRSLDACGMRLSTELAVVHLVRRRLWAVGPAPSCAQPPRSCRGVAPGRV
jgi:hypothetical protein